MNEEIKKKLWSDVYCAALISGLIDHYENPKAMADEAVQKFEEKFEQRKPERLTGVEL